MNANFCILLVCISFGSAFPEERKGRMFSLFNVVKFKNSNCQATSSAALQGSCFTSEECSDKKGIEDGNCAAGFGVCCVIKVSTCAGVVSQNNSFIESAGFPTAITATNTAKSCVYTVNKCSTDICQIRLDFVTSVLSQPPVATGLCGTDTLVILPGGGAGLQKAPPTTCGTISGQHMYIDAGQGTTTLAATLTFTITTQGTQSWRIKVSQHECHSTNKAPAGCLQYFTGLTNTATSFNFNNGANDGVTGLLTQTQDYKVCFREEAGMCGIQYAPTPVTTGDAYLLTNGDANADQAAAGCVNAGLMIDNVVPDTPATQNIFCGNMLSIIDDSIFSTALTSIGRPFQFRFYALTAAQNALSGYSLDATQIPC
jgi:hypothetical protein